jgi:hypothetical protein
VPIKLSIGLDMLLLLALGRNLDIASRRVIDELVEPFPKVLGDSRGVDDHFDVDRVAATTTAGTIAISTTTTTAAAATAVERCAERRSGRYHGGRCSRTAVVELDRLKTLRKDVTDDAARHAVGYSFYMQTPTGRSAVGDLFGGKSGRKRGLEEKSLRRF